MIISGDNSIKGETMDEQWRIWLREHDNEPMPIDLVRAMIRAHDKELTGLNDKLFKLNCFMYELGERLQDLGIDLIDEYLKIQIRTGQNEN